VGSAPYPDPPGFLRYDPGPWLPRLYRPSRLALMISRLRLQRARRRLVRRGCRTILLSLWRPQSAEAIRLVSFHQSHYYIDDEYSFSETEVPTSDCERRLIAGVDQVFISSPALFAKKGAINPHTAFVPNGVDYQAFSAALPEPPDLAVVPRPRIGYAGIVKKQLDWPLLGRLARARPDWSFVLVGPVQRDPATLAVATELASRPNVHFLGFKSLQALAAYPQHFDVCIMPYRIDDYTKYIYPLKLHEYLASGRPTVGARIPSLEPFTDVVALAGSFEEWTAVLAGSMAPLASTPEQRAARQSVARRHDWNLLVRGIARTLAQRLGHAYLERFEAMLDGTGPSAAAVGLPPEDEEATARCEGPNR